MTSPIPSGTVTFLFSDIEGSTRSWENHEEWMQWAFNRQEQIMRQAMTACGGYVYKMIGDAFQVAFDTAAAALQAALSSQQALQAEDWGEYGPLRVRMALHTGVTEERGDDYVGPALNRVARVLNAGYGGQVLLTQATCELLQDDLPPGVSLRSMGEHHLKDLIRAETIYQLAAPGLLSEFPRLKTLSALPNNLPVQRTSFVGREKEMAEVRRLLAQHRLVTLTGPGGTGKTRLALQVASEALESFEDGVWLVELAPLTDPLLIPQTTATALGITESPGETFTQALVEYLVSRQILLIFDNCEHVLEDSLALIDTLLSACPQLHVLATSREILGDSGEVNFRCPSLAVPNLRGSL
jgi:class 3 adenylate cyclase